MRCATAPVNAPLSCPKSSLSSSSAGMAAQFTFTNGRLPAFAVHVDGARDEFLARTGFAFNQHRGAGGRHHPNLIQDGAQRRA